MLLNKQTDNHLMKFPSFNYARECECRGNLEKLGGQNWPSSHHFLSFRHNADTSDIGFIIIDSTA